jgi:2-keto-4-pentenoate hydratase/2-oxohepta-3-ene-1,7-dioic acid hydratase in catechol pathway
VEEALAAASAELVLRAGDLVEVGPLPSGSPAAHGVALTMHERVAVTIERLGTLRGAAVPRR